MGRKVNRVSLVEDHMHTYTYNPRTNQPWALDNLTKEEIYRILELLYSPELQRDIFINPQHPYRRFMPFLDQTPLQFDFLARYKHVIKNMPHLDYKRSLIIPVG